MKVDSYVIGSELIETVIEKLAEADGSATNRVPYLIEAIRLLAIALAEEAEGVQS